MLFLLCVYNEQKKAAAAAAVVATVKHNSHHFFVAVLSFSLIHLLSDAYSIVCVYTCREMSMCIQSIVLSKIV